MAAFPDLHAHAAGRNAHFERALRVGRAPALSVDEDLGVGRLHANHERARLAWRDRPAIVARPILTRARRRWPWWWRRVAIVDAGLANRVVGRGTRGWPFGK